MALVKEVDKKNCESAQDMLPKKQHRFWAHQWDLKKKKAKHI